MHTHKTTPSTGTIHTMHDDIDIGNVISVEKDSIVMTVCVCASVCLGIFIWAYFNRPSQLMISIRAMAIFQIQSNNHATESSAECQNTQVHIERNSLTFSE